MGRTIYLEFFYCNKRLGNVINKCYFVNMKKNLINCVKNAIPAKKRSSRAPAVKCLKNSAFTNKVA